MKYAVVLCDGMADTPVPQLGNKTPMEVADKPCMNSLVKDSEIGLIKTVADEYSNKTKLKIAELCKGSTADSDSVCLGSNPSSAAKDL